MIMVLKKALYCIDNSLVYGKDFVASKVRGRLLRFDFTPIYISEPKGTMTNMKKCTMPIKRFCYNWPRRLNLNVISDVKLEEGKFWWRHTLQVFGAFAIDVQTTCKYFVALPVKLPGQHVAKTMITACNKMWLHCSDSYFVIVNVRIGSCMSKKVIWRIKNVTTFFWNNKKVKVDTTRSIYHHHHHVAWWLTNILLDNKQSSTVCVSWCADTHPYLDKRL